MITYADFRATEALRTEFAQWLRTDLGIIVMRVMRDKYRAVDVPPQSDALVSARILSQFHGAHTALDDFEALAIPAIIPATPESEFESTATDHDRMLTPEEVQIALNRRHHEDA
jgi:hypothetical protein